MICNIIQLNGVSLAYNNVVYWYLTAHIIIPTESVVSIVLVILLLQIIVWGVRCS